MRACQKPAARLKASYFKTLRAGNSLLPITLLGELKLITPFPMVRLIMTLFYPSNPLENLSEQEVELLHLFRQMPKSAQREMLAMFNSRVSEYAALFAEMLETKNSK